MQFFLFASLQSHQHVRFNLLDYYLHTNGIKLVNKYTNIYLRITISDDFIVLTKQLKGQSCESTYYLYDTIIKIDYVIYYIISNIVETPKIYD